MHTPVVLALSKFDVAERQLTQAIRLFFLEQDAVSIHTLAEAAAQVLYDIGPDYGVKSLTRDCDRIRPDKKKEWLAVLHSSRNFFKHANRDKHQVHNFKDVFNDMSLLDAVNMYVTIKKQWTPESLMFYAWFGVNYPELLAEDSDHRPILTNLRHNLTGQSSTDKAYFGEVANLLRSGQPVMPNLAMHFGLSHE